MRRVVAGLLVLALVVGVLAAVGLLLRDRGAADAAPDYDPVTPTAGASVEPATTPPDQALASFYEQDLTWESCGDNECATLTVPLDYGDPTGETIDLNLLKRPADDQDRKVGSLLVNPGGPGVPGTSEAEQASFYFRQPLLTYYDIVGFDPRGTGASDPVDCLSDADLDGYLAADPEPDTPAGATRLPGRSPGTRPGLRLTFGRAGVPHLHHRGGPRHGCPAGRARRARR